MSLFRACCATHVLWGFQHATGFRRRHVGASIHDAWADSLRAVRVALDADFAIDRAILLRATSQEIGATREEVIDGVVQRLDLSRKHSVDAYALAEQHETNPRSVWGRTALMPAIVSGARALIRDRVWSAGVRKAGQVSRVGQVGR